MDQTKVMDGTWCASCPGTTTSGASPTACRHRRRDGASQAGIVAAAGADVLVAGSAVYQNNDPATYGANMKAIRDAAEAAR
jgi:hypothetical protein